MFGEMFSLDLSLSEWLLFGFAGVFTGVINTLAGSGSLITLPIFIFICGLPAPIANGTNRIGVLIQSGVGILAFRKTGGVSFQHSLWLIAPTIFGAIVGSSVAATFDERLMNYAIGGLMVFMFFVLLLNPKRWIRESEPDPSKNRSWQRLLIFFAIGLYGGFIQAGVGLFLLAGLVLAAKYSLKDANAIKLLIVFCFSIPALIIFFINQQVHIGFGLSMAVFQSIGAMIGVRFASKVPNANLWIHRLLVLIVLVSASKFLGLWDLIASAF
ncbi:MAG: sulfite exporter TauE/SafE family protein [Bacteroidota bacterium]